MAYIKDWPTYTSPLISSVYRGRYHSYVCCIYARTFTRVVLLLALQRGQSVTETSSAYVVLCSEIPTVIDVKQDAFLQVTESILLRS